MRALFSAHLLHSPLVAFFYCCLIHTTRCANPPRFHTVIWRLLSSNAVWLSASAVSSQREVIVETVWTQGRSHTGSQDRPAPADSSAKLMERSKPLLDQAHAELRVRQRQPRPSLDSPFHYYPDPGLHSKAKAEAKIKWAEPLQAKQTQRERAQRERRRRDQLCTTTRFPRYKVSFLGSVGFSPSFSIPCDGADCITGTSTVSQFNRPRAVHKESQTKAGAVKMIEDVQDRGLSTQVWRTDNNNERQIYPERGNKQTESEGGRLHVENAQKILTEVSELANNLGHGRSAVFNRAQPVGGKIERVVRAQGADGSRGVLATVGRVDKHAVPSLARSQWDAEDTSESGMGGVRRHVEHTATFHQVHHARSSEYKISRSTHPHYFTFRHPRHRRERRSGETSCQLQHCPFSGTQPQGPRQSRDPENSVRDVQPVHHASVGAMPHADDVPSKASVSVPPHIGQMGLGVIRNTAASTTDMDRKLRFGRAVYLSGQEVMRLKPPSLVSPGRSLPGHHFTVEMWIKPEGGQYDPAIIIALSDTCGGLSPGGHWWLGVRTQHSGHDVGNLGATTPTDARFFFSLKTARAARISTVSAHRRYQPSTWTHLAATYDGRKMALYVNGALLSVGHHQSGEVFTAAAAPCKAMTLGGLPKSAPAAFSHTQRNAFSFRSTFTNFRGSVDEMRLWQRALSHGEVWQRVRAVMSVSDDGLRVRPKQNDPTPSFPAPAPEGSRPSHSVLYDSRGTGPLNPPEQSLRNSEQMERQSLYMNDSFEGLSKWWAERDSRTAKLVLSDLNFPPHDLSIAVPLCGQTVCDNPDVVLSYVSSWQLRSSKQVRYRVINLMNDDGSNPTVTDLQILKQHDFLNRAFRSYNISFLLDVHDVRNSTLRKRLVMFGCELEHIGDGICNQECMHTQTGLDGGDCDTERLPCAAHHKGNGRCDFECNKYYHDWDGGDCCLPGNDTHYTCYDPHSPYRAFVVVDEFRQLVGLRSDSHLNVFIAVCSDWSTHHLKAPHLIGLATFPWEKHVYSVQGGTVIQQQTFGTVGQMDSLVHEVGHNLGLWHVHHGVSEVECSDPCAETQASMVLGDLCADTAPTSDNVHCRDPGPATDHCSTPASFTHTPFRNYMSYADDNCTDHFTEQQVARMHCYLDLAYQPWRLSQKPSPVPLPPKVVAAEAGSVTVAWVPPLGRGADHLGSVCSLCDTQGALVQFASFASSPAPNSDVTGWSPHQATGPPDAEPCVPSMRAWLPDVSLCTRKMPCRLDLMLQVPVVAHILTLWVTWNADGVRRIRLLYVDGTSSVLKAIPAFCDMPFTVTLSDTRRLHKVQVYTRTPFTAIDALQVVSTPQHTYCQYCQPISYRVFRRPGMIGQYFRLSQDTHFTDHEVESGVSYLYWVEAVSGSSSSQPSPVLNYTHGQAFCGDGNVDRDNDEDCDDGNILSGDGCDVTCHIEHSFHCKGGPSVCYRHDGDGVCEEFERASSVLDCGFYTPEGYWDQWAHHAVANDQHQLPACPARLATGPPPLTQPLYETYPDSFQWCGPLVEPRTAWFPCGAHFNTGNFWIELYMPRPVVATEVIVHVAADGRTEADPAPKELSVELIREDNSTVMLTPHPVTLDCRQQELHVTVIHDLSKPFYKSHGVRLSFQSHNVSIAAVRLRSSRYLDPVTLASCGQQEVYHPHTGLCLSPNCTRAPCHPPDVRHGRVLCTGQTEGDVCVVTCDNGYKPESQTMELSCRGGHWVSSDAVACMPMECGRPSMPNAVVSCVHGTTFGQKCTFHCQPPSSLHGFDNWIVCEEDGLWSTPRAHCLVTCSPPLHVQHVTRHKKRCRTGSLVVGSRCKMRCKKGFHVAGARRSTRRVFRLTCQRDGTWSGEHCVKVTCPKFDPVFTGLLSCTDDVKVASRCTLVCPGSNEAQIVTCNANGQWNTPLWHCPQFDDVTCPYPAEVTNVALRCSPPIVGAQCSVACPTPDEVAVFSSASSGRTKRRDIVGEVVNSITCTGTGRWFPPLDRLACVEKCSTEFIGDTWCDARNNREYCQWDGGDCCQSTLGTKVKPFEHSCGADCMCKDPKATENQKEWGTVSRRRGSG